LKAKLEEIVSGPALSARVAVSGKQKSRRDWRGGFSIRS
jgi:hypothetical protein